MQLWLGGRAVDSVVRDATGTWVATLHDTRGTLLRVVWNPAGDTPFTVPREWDAVARRDLQGQMVALPRDGQISVGVAPVLIGPPMRSPQAPTSRR